MVGPPCSLSTPWTLRCRVLSTRQKGSHLTCEVDGGCKKTINIESSWLARLPALTTQYSEGVFPSFPADVAVIRLLVFTATILGCDLGGESDLTDWAILAFFGTLSSAWTWPTSTSDLLSVKCVELSCDCELEYYTNSQSTSFENQGEWFPTHSLGRLVCILVPEAD